MLLDSDVAQSSWKRPVVLTILLDSFYRIPARSELLTVDEVVWEQTERRSSDEHDYEHSEANEYAAHDSV